MKRLLLPLLLILSACLTAANAPAYDLQTAIDNAPNGGTVVIPCGIYDIGDVVIASNTVWQKVVTITGCGHGHLGQSPGQNSTQWDYLLDRGYYYGTVLRGTISVKKGAYTGATTAKLYIRDLSLIGYGSGIGIDYGDGTNMFPEGAIESVSIGNYDVGIRLQRAYYMSIDDVSMAGVGVGLQVIDSNVITVTGLNIVACGTGLLLTGNGNSYNGGSVQGCGAGAVFGGSGSTMTGYYYEQNTTALTVNGRANIVLGNYYAGNAGTISVTGHNNYLYMSEWVNPISVTGNYNRVELSAYGACNDTGFANRCTRLWPQE